MANQQSKGDLPKVSREDVAHLARLYGLHIGEDDLAEVAFRLGALLDEVEKLNQLDLGQVEPIPISLPEEER